MLRKYLPGYRSKYKAKHGQLLKVEYHGHDVVAEVEWSDGTVTYQGADFVVEEDVIQLKNGLKFAVKGQGGDPVYISGVPVVRVKSVHAAPVDTRVAIAMGMEDDGEYARVDESGNVIEDNIPDKGYSEGDDLSEQGPDIDGNGHDDEPAQADSGPSPTNPTPTPTVGDGGTATVDGGDLSTPTSLDRPDGVEIDEDGATIGAPVDAATGAAPDAETDGGVSAGVGHGEDADDHIYDLRPPKGLDGFVFSLTDAVQHVPNPVSPMDLKFQEERGRQSANKGRSTIKTMLIGMGASLLVVFVLFGFLFLLNKLGGTEGSTINFQVQAARFGAATLALLVGRPEFDGGP
jgi:hypothetical protein